MKTELCAPLTGNWTHPDSKLRFSTKNHTAGTLVQVTCDQMYSDSGTRQLLSRVLECRQDGNWNDTLPPCPVLQTSLENTGSRTLSTEVIIIWSIGGAMLIILISLLIAIICAKRKDFVRGNSRSSRPERPVSTIGLQNPGFVSMMDQYNHHCIITGGEGCNSQTYPIAPPPYPGPPREVSADRSPPPGSSPPPAPSATHPEQVNSLPRPQAESTPRESRDSGRQSVPNRLPPAYPGEARRQVPEPPRTARSRDVIVTSSSRSSSSTPRSSTASGNPNRIQGRQSRICPQPRRLAPAHTAVPVTDIMDPPPPYTPYPDYDFPNCLRPQRQAGNRRPAERMQSLYI